MAPYNNRQEADDYFTMEPWNMPLRYAAHEVTFVQAHMIYNISTAMTHFGVLNLGTAFTPLNIS